MQSLMYGNLYLLHCHSYSICWIENPTTFTQYQYQCLIQYLSIMIHIIIATVLCFVCLKNIVLNIWKPISLSTYSRMYTQNTHAILKTKCITIDHTYSGYRGCIYLDSRVVTSSWFDTILNFTYNQTDKKRQHSSVLIGIFLQYIYIGKNIVNKAYTIMQWH